MADAFVAAGSSLGTAGMLLPLQIERSKPQRNFAAQVKRYIDLMSSQEVLMVANELEQLLKRPFSAECFRKILVAAHDELLQYRHDPRLSDDRSIDEALLLLEPYVEKK